MVGLIRENLNLGIDTRRGMWSDVYMTTTTATTRYIEFIIKVRCGGRTYSESVITLNAEHAWGHAARIERQYEIDYGYKARVVSVKEVK